MPSEAEIQQEIRLESWRRGTPLLRNNSGATLDATGRMIRYGLGNDSSKINKRFKSSDLIGIWPVIVTQAMVGEKHGLFFAVEVKTPGASRNDERARAQGAFGDWVKSHGGVFTFASDTKEVW